MKEVIVISGKGGTGKTSITGAFAHLEGSNAAIADCDVDASNLHLLLEPKIIKSEAFFSGYEAHIESKGCSGCGVCAQYCQFDAIQSDEFVYAIDLLRCEGCGLCARICPNNAIKMRNARTGDVFVSETRFASPMVHAKLVVAAENSGKLVSKVKEQVKEIAEAQKKKVIIVDGSPGIGCPVVASLSDASFVVLVTEPSISGVHDLKRVYELVRRFNLPAGVIINKADLNAANVQNINDYITANGLKKLVEIPYSETFPQALTQRKTLIEWGDQVISSLIEEAWKRVQDSM